MCSLIIILIDHGSSSSGISMSSRTISARLSVSYQGPAMNDSCQVFRTSSENNEYTVVTVVACSSDK
jgi:hypothetical protein